MTILHIPCCKKLTSDRWYDYFCPAAYIHNDRHNIGLLEVIHACSGEHATHYMVLDFGKIPEIGLPEIDISHPIDSDDQKWIDAYDAVKADADASRLIDLWAADTLDDDVARDEIIKNFHTLYD